MNTLFKRVGYALASLAFAFIIGAPALVNATGTTTYVGTNTGVSGDDVVSDGTYPIGFNFHFYDTDYSSVYVGTNGTLMFNDPTSSLSGDALPSGALGAAILPFWEDLYSGDAQNIYYTTIGSPGSRQFIIQWTNESFCCNEFGVFGTFQVILSEGSNKIQIQYPQLDSNDDAHGAGASIGIQQTAEDGGLANQFSIDTPSVSSGSAIEYTPDGDGGYTDNGHAATFEDVLLSAPSLPGAFNLGSPTDGMGDADVLPSFTWDASDGATSYHLGVSTDPSMGQSGDDDVNEINNVSTNSYSYIDAEQDPLQADTTYYWRVISYNDNGATYSAIHSFTTTDHPDSAPLDISDFSPGAILDDNTVDPTVLLSTPLTFSVTDPDEGDQVQYEVRISTSNDPGDPATIDYKSPLGPQGETSFTYGQNDGTYLTGDASTRLVDGTGYYFLVRVIDQHGVPSDWAGGDDGVNFVYNATPTDDNDGSTNTVENASPNSGDANNDGFPDSWQANVSDTVDPVTNAYSVLQTSGGCDANQSVGVVSEPSGSGADSSYAYPAGLMDFTINCSTPGATATITQYFYGLTDTGMVARKYDPTTHAYTTIPGAVVTNVTIGGQPVVKVVYDVTDGGPLDQDGSANGVIVDPSGPAVLGTSATNSLSAPNTGLAKISMLPFVLSFIGGAYLIARRTLHRR